MQQLGLPFHNGHPTHCAYRGCMNPLPKMCHKHNGKFFCDSDCAERDDHLNEKLAKERH